MKTTTTTVITALAVILLAFPTKKTTAYPSKITVRSNESCLFSEILFWDSPSLFQYGCISNVNVELETDCSATIFPAMLITGNTDNVDGYNIMIDGQNTAILLGCGLHTYSIEVIENGEVVYNCWGDIWAEDKSPPQIDCPADISQVNIEESPSIFTTYDLICNDINQLFISDQGVYWVNANGSTIATSLSTSLKTILDITGYPVVTDNCGPVVIIVSDEIISNGDCGEVRIIRTFHIADRADGLCIGEAYTNECQQQIIFRKPLVADITLPAPSFTLECHEVFPTDGAIGGPANNPSPIASGFPFIETAFGIYSLTDNYCNIGSSYSDEERIFLCEGSYEIRREWNIIDWCTPNNSFVFQQFIQVGDFIGPLITLDIPDYDNDGAPDDALYASTSPFGCEAIFSIPFATITDANTCSSISSRSVNIQTTSGLFIWTGAEESIISLAIGDYRINYCAQDDCGNETCEEWPLEIRDDIAPTASCNEELIVAIGGGDIQQGIEGIAHLLAEDIDEGSSDNCSIVHLQVRRNHWLNDTCHPNENRWSPWSEAIDFYCCDMAAPIKIELLVTDTSGNWNSCWLVVTPEDKLVPYCYAPQAVNLSCLNLPLAFPSDIITAYNENFQATSETMNALLGAAAGTDNCAVDTIVERTPQLNINDCGWGTITRRFEAWQLLPTGDQNLNGQIDRVEAWVSNNNCTQLISITETHDYHIDFPQDASADCAAPCIWAIMVEAEGCDVLAVNVGTPVRFSATADECYKLSITYDVINWCLWDGEYEGYEIPRMTEDDGEDLAIDRAVESSERPMITGDDYGVLLSRNHLRRTICMNGLGGYVPNDNSSLDNTTDIDIPDLNLGRWRYTQFVKVYDSTAPIITVGEYGGPTELCPTLESGQFGDPFGMCEVSVNIPFWVTDSCEVFNNEGELVISLISAEIDLFALDTNYDGIISGNEIVTEADVANDIIQTGDSTFVILGEYPVLNPILAKNSFHAVQIVFGDGCGNLISQIIQFGVIDCKPPSPICINGLTITLQPQPNGQCANTIWATDFEASPIYDCTGQGPDTSSISGLARVTEYAIYRASDVDEAENFTPYPSQSSLELNEDDLETGIVIVYVYAFDGAENYDYCETYITVEAHESCGAETANLSGVIHTEEYIGIENVTINASNNTIVTTEIDGSYSLYLEAGGDYTITPFFNENVLNGVSTFDLVLISKHILGVQSLGSPYKMIAADVNRSNTITTLDLIQIRKLILNIITEYSNNNSWRFVDALYEFPQSNNPWLEAFPELINENNLIDNTVHDANFIGVKVGDVNDSVVVGQNWNSLE